MSDSVCVDARFVFKLPEHVDLDVGALVEPLAVAWHAVGQVGIFPVSERVEEVSDGMNGSTSFLDVKRLKHS